MGRLVAAVVAALVLLGLPTSAHADVYGWRWDVPVDVYVDGSVTGWPVAEGALSWRPSAPA